MKGARLETDYAGFAERAASIGAALRARFGVAPGDRVALFMTNRTEYLEALYGVWTAGAVAVPINAKLHPKEAAWIVEDAAATVLFVSEDVGGPFRAHAPACLREIICVESPAFAALRRADPLSAPERRRGADLTWLFYTSGTTGKPKGVMLSAANLQAMALSYCVDVDQVRQSDAILYAAPISHGAGLYNFMHVRAAAPHVAPESGGFDPDEILDLAPQIADVSMFAAPTMVRRLVDLAKARGLGGEGLKTIVYGGGPMYLADIEDAVAAMGPRFVQIYGQGECPMSITALSRGDVADRAHPNWRTRLGSVGRAHSCTEVRVVDAEGRDLPTGAVGEIIASGLAVMQGYWRNPEASAATLKDGWLWTGDLGALDADGFLTLHDRSKDVIISGGTNIYPREIEEALLAHPSIAETAVIGRPHRDWGEEVVAFVVAAPGAQIDPAALDRHCLEMIARFKRPKAYVALDALPKNNYGKVLKTALREQLKETAP